MSGQICCSSNLSCLVLSAIELRLNLKMKLDYLVCAFSFKSMQFWTITSFQYHKREEECAVYK